MSRLVSTTARYRRISGIVAVVAVAMSSLSACGDTDAGKLGKGDEYVALGDSYTAAPRIGPPAARDGCIRTTKNYPHQVAARLGLDLTDVSCSGAMTEHVTTPQKFGKISRPPQIEAVSSNTDLVTVSLGANDFYVFAGVVFSCTALRARNPSGAPCTAANAAAGERSIANRGAQIEERIAAVIRLVKKRAPKARIVVVGYPQFFPVAGPCEQLPLAAGDFTLARRVNELLVQAQKAAATKTKVDYVDVFSATAGHDMCAEDPWIAGLRPTRPNAMFYHPYLEEQQVVADLLVELLR